MHARNSARFDAGNFFLEHSSHSVLIPMLSLHNSYYSVRSLQVSPYFCTCTFLQASFIESFQNAACIDFQSVDPRPIVNIEAPSYRLCWLQCSAAAIRTQGMQYLRNLHVLGKCLREMMRNRG